MSDSKIDHTKVFYLHNAEPGAHNNVEGLENEL